MSRKVGDAVPVILIVILLFILPDKPNFWCWRTETKDEKVKANKSLIGWSFVQAHVPWGLFLIIGKNNDSLINSDIDGCLNTTGGGVACADAAKISGLSKLIGEELGVLGSLPKFVIMLLVCLFISFLTEIVSNTAMANIVLPVLAQMVPPRPLTQDCSDNSFGNGFF